ncbi:MAG: nuclear transport factor 2 family protein [Leptospiraceae bacterium]|nr:nuclear transport factor 2 family protein [Leptospiraceae bacterium]
MKFLISILFILFLMPNSLFSEDPTHNELRELKSGLEKAFQEKKLDSLLDLLHPNIVITWHNAEVSRRREGVKKYIDRMIFAENPVVKKFDTKLDVDELTILYDNTGIAFGTSTDKLELTEGTEINSTNRWTATVYKEDGKWQITSVHLSSNLFDNPLLDLYKNKLYLFAIISLLLGIAIGYGIRSFKK